MKFTFLSRLIRPVDALGLGVFRVVFGVMMMSEISDYISYFHLINEPVPYLSGFSKSNYFLIYLWFLIALFLAIGFFTQWSAIFNYLFATFYFSDNLSYAYHVHLILVNLSLLMIFFPLHHSLSMDSILTRKNVKTYDRSVPIYYYYLFICFALAFVYIDSSFWKLFSTAWKNGISFWIGASYLPIAKYDLTPLLNYEWLMQFLCYATLLFEAIFIFLIFHKWTRWTLTVFGVFMHLCISLIFPLGSFGIMFALFYTLLIPISLWRKMFDSNLVDKISSTLILKLPRIKIRLHPELHIISKLRIPFILVIAFFQLLMFAKPFFEEYNYSMPSKLKDSVQNIYQAYNKFKIRQLTGVAPHALFLDAHFVPRKVFKIYCEYEGRSILLPITTNEGLNHNQLKNLAWKYWSLNTYDLNKAVLIKYASYWSYHLNIDLRDAEFKVYSKMISPASNWEFNYLKKLMTQEWKICAIMRVKNDKFQFIAV